MVLSMNLYYYTGTGTLLDRRFAALLQLEKDELVEVTSKISVQHTCIEYFVIKKINSSLLPLTSTVHPFTSRATKPFTLPEEKC